MPFSRKPVGRRSAGRGASGASGAGGGRAARDWSDAQRLRYWWQTERELLLRALAAVPAEAVDRPLAEGAWSAKGMAAHRLFWEAEERAALEAHLGGAAPSLLDFPTDRIDATNAAAVHSLGARRMPALLRALADLRERTAALVERIADAELNEPGNPARILLGVALEHDREHRQQLEARFGALGNADRA